ncbi:alpha/beta-hydrolase [Macrolepiota fuliginosa MF-IS2]|uniref:Alpha/beta-hydrolase n=1 Tax=Macrolepiota fuliginosa MF-IS2 TaxID=1400762 RepID=A0A9P5XIR7_9AGAR|nr:alpha/beta-hydrolase [Macrolepiota fuliginosa MF-IS2]
MDSSSVTGSISAGLYEDLVHYFKYASSAYCLVCPRPNGKTLVTPFTNLGGDIQGYVARDDGKREIIVAFRGSASIIAFLADALAILVPFVAPGVSVPAGVRVHTGFLLSWDSVALEILMIVSRQVKLHPEYAIVTSGHSLGGVLALFGAITLKQKYPNKTVRTYSYGAPRAGNKDFAMFVNEMFGENAYRVVHGNDGVPTIIPTALGYYHHGIEYWQYTYPVSEETTRACAPDGEDPTCSACISSRGINPAHWTYFGILATRPFCL